MSRGRTTHEVNIQKVRGQGAELPTFLRIAHRHFEKAPPVGAIGDRALVTCPVDLLELLAPSILIADIESIEICYRKKAL